MPFAATADLVSAAATRRGAVGAFNVVTLEHAEAVVAGAEAVERAVVLQVSQNAVAFHFGRLSTLAAACRALAGDARVPVGLHLDHVEDEDLAAVAPAEGFGSVMFDGSRLPFAENVARTRAVCERAHLAGLWVEAELGDVGGKGGAHAPGARTDPDEAALFVAETSVDALAVAVGSDPAMTSRTAVLDLDLLARLHAAVPVPLVLQGSSGVPDDGLGAAVECGIVKVNIGTALNVVLTAEVRRALATNAEVTDPRRWLAPARDAVAAEVARIADVLG
jgi:fructose-bisphosphate aldolase class II